MSPESVVVVDRVDSDRGELVLRRVGADFEIVSNGVFLMDTRSGASERLLVRAALDAAATRAEVLVGGLGMGFSVAEACADPAVASVTVVEVEPAIVAWHGTHLRETCGRVLEDPRVRVVVADLVEWLPATGHRFDVVCLDIDNGPTWTVTPSNDRLYAAEGLRAAARLLRPGGALAVWSAADSPRFERLLRQAFAEVAVHRVPVPRGEPDVVYVAVGPTGRSG